MENDVDTIEERKTHITNSSTLGVVEERDKVVSWMRNNGAEDSSNVSTGKAHAKLERLAALLLWCGDRVFVEQLHNGLKGCKLHHCICNDRQQMIQ